MIGRYLRGNPRYTRRGERGRVTACGICAVSLAVSVASLAISLATLAAVQ